MTITFAYQQKVNRTKFFFIANRIQYETKIAVELEKKKKKKREQNRRANNYNSNFKLYKDGANECECMTNGNP